LLSISLFIDDFTSAARHAVVGRVHALRWQRQRLQQRQTNIGLRVHNVKRFATLAIPMSFRCHGDVIIDVSRLFSVILGAKQVVHTRYSPLATSTLRISFRCHMGANCCRIDISGSPVASGLLQRASLKIHESWKIPQQKNKIALLRSSTKLRDLVYLLNILDRGERRFLFILQIRSLSQSPMISSTL